MTKIGEGKELPQEPTEATYHKEVEKNASKFLNALDQYEASQSEEERAHFKAVMDQSLELMRAAVREIHRDGLRKQEGVIEHDYRAYMGNENTDTLSALREDLSEFRDNNKLP